MINKGVTVVPYRAIQDVTNICDNIRHNVTIMVTTMQDVSH